MTELLEQLKYWRAERPDEWKMDEFLRLAEEQNKRIAELVQENHTAKAWLATCLFRGIIDQDCLKFAKNLLATRDLEQQAKGLEDYAHEQLSGLNAMWMLARASKLIEQAKTLKEQGE